MCEARIENHELRWSSHEFLLPERNVKGRERKVSTMPLGLNLNLASKLLAFATDQQINSKFIRIFGAFKSKLVPETRGGLFKII